MKRSLLAALALGAACVTISPYARNQYANVTSYQLSWTRKTPAGISLDDPQHQLVDADIDARAARVEACLAQLPKLTYEEKLKGRCITTIGQPFTVDRRWVAVKVAPDWHLSRCTGKKLFPCKVDPALCDDKPELGGVTCPCECRGAVQDNALVTTPDLETFEGDLIRLVTTCNNPWGLALLAACAAPPPR